MSDTNKRRTLANCKLSEFTTQALKVRNLVNEYYNLINVPEIIEKYRDEDLDENKDKIFRKIISDIAFTSFTKYPDKYVQIIAAEAFLSVEEAEELAPSEALEIFLECAISQRVIDFFINVEAMVQTDTASILPVLILLRQATLEMNSSGSELQNSMTDISEKSTNGDTSENALEV